VIVVRGPYLPGCKNTATQGDPKEHPEAYPKE
jgi:hypothetical protein